MLITKFDLYRTEWLDLVFTNRNKNYGAYELRQTYASTMLKSMGLTFFGVGVAIAIITLTTRTVTHAMVYPDREVIVNLDKVITPPKTVTPPASKPAAAAAAPAAERVRTTAIPTQVVPDDPALVDPPINDKIEGAVGPDNVDGPKGGDNVISGSGINPGGTGTTNGTDEGSGTEIYNFNAIEVLPEPFGGKEAWSKFLQKNLRYPAAAESEGLSGRVFISFIIEKDGRLTDFKVERAAGFGFDEEALRVLKKAPAWRPGIQNGRPVRVKYTIPINFRVPE